MNHSMFQAIDSVAEMGDSDNREHMVVVSRNLHQIRGSLQMVELDAASTFAGDLELLTDRLAEDVDMPDQVSAIRVLRSGLELLRRYLKTIEAQSPQSPLFLMDQMNAVRDITGQRQLSGFDLFDPPLEAVYPHSDETMAFQDSRLENVVSHLRKRYRKSLLEWMNGSSPTQALDAMRDMMMHLRKIAGPGVLQQLWWVAAGFIDAIRAEGIELNPEIYARLAELDVQMGRMRTQRMVDIASTPPNELIRWMLYAVGQARLPGPADSNGASGTTREIKEMFGLDQWFFLDDDSYVVDEFWDLVNAVEALSRIISESDIQYLEEAVDRYFSTDPDEEYKRELFADLEKLRKAVHEHDVGVVRDFVDVLCETIMGIDVDSGVLAQSRADIKVASSILLLGDTLKKPSIISSEWKDSVQQRIEELNRLQQQDFSVEDSAGENQQARLELVNATTALVREARRHLNGVEELLLAGPANESMDAGDLSGVRDLLQKTARLLWFVNAPGTGELVNRTDTILARHLESGQDVSGTMREELIFLVASIEIVVETIGEGNPEPREILEQARARLDALESADVLPEQDEKDDPEPADEKGDIAPDGAAVDGEPSSEDQATDQASDPAGKAMGSPEQHAKEILELVDPVADAPDEFLSGKGTGEVAPENETAADAVDQGLEQRLFSVPEQIDSLRRSIDAGSDDKATIEALSALFSSLMTDQSPEFRNEIRQVAAIGHSVTTGLIRRQVGYNNEINDFLGLLTRQMTSLIAGREDVEVQLSAWVSRAAALLDEAAPASRADDMEPEVLSDGPDHDLMETFSRELEQHATGLEQAAEKFLLGIDGPGEGGEDLDTECERISRIVHTLAGNFNALGFSEYGNCICELEEIFLESRGKADLMQEYVPYLRQFSALIRMMSDRIGTGHQVPPGFDADLTGISDLITAAYGEAATAVDTGETLPDDDMSPSLVDEDHGGADTVHVQPAPGGLPEQPDILEENAISGEADSDSADAENVAVQVLQDDDFDQELKEVFREESEMILSRINGLLTRWKSEGLNREILSGILREFHTLKGSAAATGFDEISGLSHAIESLLERAVDHGADTGDASTLGLLEEMHDGIASDLGIIPGGEAGRIVSLQGALDDWLSRPDPLPATDEAVSDETAEKPAHPGAGGVVPDAGPVPENVAATDPEPVSESAVELAEAAVSPEDSDQTADDMAAEPEAGQASPASALGEDVPGPGIEEEISPQESQDDDFDQEMKEVFREESEMILSRINGLLTRWKSEGLNREILSGILREFHTLKGSAAATGFDEISNLSHAIESLLERAVDHGADTGDTSTLGLLEEMHDGIASDLGIIPGGEAGRIVSLQGVLDDWLSRPDPLPATDEAVSDEIAEKPAHPEAGGVVPDTGPVPENVAATDPEPVSGSAVELAEAAVLPEDSDQTADDMAAEPETGQASPASALGEDVPGPGIEEEISPQESQDDDFDQEMKEVFREESEMILGRINEWLTGWKADGFSQEVLAGILREFHTLKGSAAATGFDEISGLSHAMESLLDGEIVHGSDFGDEAILNLLEEMHDGIASELGFIPGGEAGHIVALKGVVDTLLSREPDVRMPGDSVSAEKEGGVADEAISEDMPEIAGDARQPACDTVDSTPDAMPDPVPQEPEQERQASSGLADTAVDRAGLPPVDEPGMPEAEQPFPRQWTPADEEAFGADFGAGTTGYMRIESRKLADLLNFSGEMGLTRTQLRSTIGNARKELIRMRGSMEKIREGLRDLEFEADAQMRSMPERHQPDTDDEEFDPLQLDRYSRLQARAREVSRYLDELGRVERQLEERAAEISGALVQQSHVGEQLHEQLLDARLVNVGEYFPRFRTLIREFSRRMGKRVAFEVSGGDVNVDRQVMDLMIAPFEHMIRNAISHGVELPDRRRELGKTETGSITMSVVQQGSELVIGFGDDGSGLDREKLRQQAVRSGLTDPDTPMTDDMMLRVIAEPGFSTAEEVTMGAGRGVGMDVVVEVVRTLGGGLSVTSEPGKGTTFHFRLPVTMTVSQALLVRVGSYRFAVLTRTLERVMRVRSGDFEMIEDRLHVRFGDQMAPVIDLVDLIGEMSLSTEEEFRSIILARVGERVAAIQVDLFEETIDIVSKTPGRQLTSIPGISGVTVLADTTIVLILNLGELVQREATIELTERQIRPDIQADREEPADDGGLPDVGIPDASAPSEDAGSIERVLVVDDSIVVRRVMCRDLEAIGMTPIAAVDGLDALDQLERHEVDFLLIDLEMPRMNGYELLINLKQDERFARLPVVVITSRSSDTHRERAVRLGADGYVTKPYDIRQLEQLMLSIATARHAMH